MLELGPFLVALVVTLIAFCVSGFLSFHCFHVETVIEEREVYSISDSVQDSGSFVLGCGHTASDAYYAFYVESPIGVKLELISADEAYLRETSGTPSLVKIGLEYQNPVLRKWFWNFAQGYSVIYVPEDTIQRSFNLDSE